MVFGGGEYVCGVGVGFSGVVIGVWGVFDDGEDDVFFIVVLFDEGFGDIDVFEFGDGRGDAGLLVLVGSFGGGEGVLKRTMVF